MVKINQLVYQLQGLDSCTFILLASCNTGSGFDGFYKAIGMNEWNDIPSSLKEVSFDRFKKAVKAHFLLTYETDKS